MKTAFFSEPSLKESLLVRLREHQRLDAIMQRDYYDGTKGCHLGCITHQNEGAHEATERLFGIPIKVAYWLEVVFEGLPLESAKRWVTDSIESIPVGADLSMAHHHLAVWLQSGESGLFKTREVNHRVADLHRRSLDGDEPLREEWDSARWAAIRSADSALLYEGSFGSSIRSAVWSAVLSAVWSAENCSDDAVAKSVKYAAYASVFAKESTAVFAKESTVAKSVTWARIAEKSIKIFSASPVRDCEECSSCIAETREFLSQPVVVDSFGKVGSEE